MAELEKAGLKVEHKRSPIGIMPNAAHQRQNSIFQFPTFELAMVEFDDQGRCQDREQMRSVTGKLEELKDRDAIIVVFVHGWKHDGRTDDDNLDKFCEVLTNVAAEDGARSTPVLGIFVLWRGLSFYGFGILENITFWDRKQAGLRVATGAVRELFGRLRQYRQKRLDRRGAPLLIIIGHSFGGLIVFSAIAQSLIEAAATQAGELVPSFADLVLLVNPAFEAVRYLPIHDLVKLRADAEFDPNQTPVFVSVTANNDWATGYAFPAGMGIARFQESAKGREEKTALIRTMGHVSWMRTHELSAAPTHPSSPMLKQTQFSERNPFWVVAATPEVIDGHNGIWLPTFRFFVRSLIVEHVEKAQRKRAS